MIDSKYLTFSEYESTSGKTKVVVVGSKSGDFELATIKWYGPWRTYVLVPASETVWNKGCLEDVNAYIDQLMEERERKSCSDPYCASGGEPCIDHVRL